MFDRLFRRNPPAKLLYANQGRCGHVWYESPKTRFAMYWEFGGGDVLAIIDIPPVKDWESATKLPLAERAGVLDFIARQAVKDQTTFGRNRYEITDRSITIYA